MRYLTLIILAFSAAVSEAQLSSFTVPATKDQLTVYIDSPQSNGHWALALDVSKTKELSISAAKVPVRKLTPGISWNTTASDLAPDNEHVRISDDVVHLIGNRNGEGVFAKIDIPSGHPIAIIQDGKTVFLGEISGGVDIVDGIVSTGTKASTAKLLMLLSFPSAIVDNFGEDFASTTDMRVTTSGLRRHLVGKLPPIQLPVNWGPVHDAKSQARLVVVTITIGANGLVTGTELTSGSGEFADNVLASVKNARFTPFLRDDIPVSVIAGISYNLASDGTVRSSLD